MTQLENGKKLSLLRDEKELRITEGGTCSWNLLLRQCSILII